MSKTIIVVIVWSTIMSRFFCDNCCDLTQDQVNELGIEVIRIPYFLEGKLVTGELGAEFDSEKFFDNMKNGATVSTSALNPLEYTEIWEPILANGEDILYVAFSHNMSGTFNNMNVALTELRQKYPQRTITVVDTQLMALGLGLVVYLAAKKHKEGATDVQVVEYVKDICKKVRTYVTVEDLKYLKRGGRVSGITAFIGGILNIKPILKLVDGNLIKVDKVKGRKTSLKYLLNVLETENVDTNYPITLGNAHCKEDAEQFTADIKDKYPNAEVWNQSIGLVVGCHSGPGTVALFFLSKD